MQSGMGMQTTLGNEIYDQPGLKYQGMGQQGLGQGMGQQGMGMQQTPLSNIMNQGLSGQNLQGQGQGQGQGFLGNKPTGFSGQQNY